VPERTHPAARSTSSKGTGLPRIAPGAPAETLDGEPAAPLSGPVRWALARLVLLGFAGGVASCAFWMFGPDLVVTRGGLASRATVTLWLAVGLSGLAGGWASDLARGIGSRPTHALAVSGIAGGTALLASEPSNHALAILAAALFGAAFMTLAGLHLVTAEALLGKRPALGAVLPFLAIAIGQAAGSPLAGEAIEACGYVGAFRWFSLLALALAACSPIFPLGAAGPRAGATPPAAPARSAAPPRRSAPAPSGAAAGAPSRPRCRRRWR